MKPPTASVIWWTFAGFQLAIALAAGTRGDWSRVGSSVGIACLDAYIGFLLWDLHRTRAARDKATDLTAYVLNRIGKRGGRP